MFSIVRIFVAFHAAAYLALVGLTPATSFALATPFPMPMMMAKNHSSSLQDEAGPLSKSPKAPSNSSASHSTPAPSTPRTLIPTLMRSIYPRQDLLDLAGIVSDAHGNSQSLQQCSCSDSNQQLPSTYLGLLSGNLLDFQNCIEGADSGKQCMASYDKNSDLQKVVEDLLNFIKDALTYINKLINCSPLLQPLCQPLVYQIKCFLDWLLDCITGSTDKLLESLIPLIEELSALCGTCSLDLCLLQQVISA